MRKGWAFLLLLLVIGAGALALRLPRLGLRPMHADEAVQAARFRDLWQHARFVYDPNEFHGPTLIYATLPAAWLSGSDSFADTTEATYRIVPVLFGTTMVVLAWLLADGLGKTAAVAAGLLMAVSPAMVFYSRYFIHETLLVFFTLAAIAAGWLYARSGRLGWCLIAGGCIGLMQATKETSVIVYFAAAAAAGLTWGWARCLGERRQEELPRYSRWHLAVALAVAVVVAAVVLSSFFSNPRGPLDGLLTYAPWLLRAGGESPHVHPWYDYLHRLAFWRVGNGPWWSEGFVLLLAGVGTIQALLPRRFVPSACSVGLLRWLAFYAIVLGAAYSVIPYKTPWCLLGILQAMTLLAGVGAAVLLRLAPGLLPKVAIAAVLLGGAGHLGWQAYRASYQLPADRGNPYVYVQTSPDAVRLAGDLRQLATAASDGENTRVKVIWQDAYYWPLPWYLRGFTHVELWTALPEQPAAPLVIASPAYDTALTESLGETHLMTGYYEIRPQVLAELWVRMDVWEAHLRHLGRL